MQWRKLARLKTAPGQSRARRMLCCGRRKENGRSVPDLTASPGRAPPGPAPQSATSGRGKEPVLLQGDFRKVSGISSEIFRQIETVENDHDSSTAAALEAVERRGEMIVRLLEPRMVGGRQACDAAQRLMNRADSRHTVQLVEIVKRPGQTLGLYIREGNGAERSDGVFISRIALESAVYNSGCLRVGDEILAVNLVDVTHMSLDDVVIIMSIPRRLVLATRQRRGGRGLGSPGQQQLSRPEQKPPPVVVIKRELRDEDSEAERIARSRSSRERRTGDGREMTESRSRLGLGLAGYSPPPEQPHELYYNSRPAAEPPPWGYKPPPPPPVITEQPKGSAQHFASYYQNMSNTGTLESLAEKVHSFYPGRRMSTGTGASAGSGLGSSHPRFPRSGSDQHLPRVEYSDFSSLGRHSLLRSSLKSGALAARYGQRYEPPAATRSKYAGSSVTGGTLTRRSRTLDYSSDTEATCGPRPAYYYYRNQIAASRTAAPDIAAKFNSLPRDSRPGGRMALRSRLGERLGDEADGALSAPELPSAQARRDRGRIPASPSIFTSDEYRAWLRRAPSSSAICEQMRASREVLNQQRAHRFSCSAENIHDALKNTENALYGGRVALAGLTGGTLDRHIGRGSPAASGAIPVRSLSTQHLGTRSPSVRRMRQLLELGTALPHAHGPHASPAPTPSATLPRSHRHIDINPAEFLKYKLDKPSDGGAPGSSSESGVSGMLWIHLLAGRGLRAAPEPGASAVRDLYCVLECDRVHKARTVVRGGDLQFDWDESFELDLVSNRQLDLLVYSWDPQHRHKLCYRGAVSLCALLRQSPLHQLALKVDPRGTLYLRLRHTDAAQLYRRRGLPALRGACPALFGADLETVVAREAKATTPGGPPVPVVVRRCVEEVERRGLDIIGLYRLCGSATKKRLLREAFERNSRAVELSPDHVPDINVITGVLKDYLRELPEPLFTRCLYQMTVDALGVCLPDDPEGNAKLMLSILDCLPRANRATLVFLLDHLSLVVSASERNKMSAQALATALGPPLMLHATPGATGSGTGEGPVELDHSQPIAVLKYLLQIWPNPNHTHVSGRRAEPVVPRGGKASVSPAVRQPPPGHRPHSASPCQQAVLASAVSAPTGPLALSGSAPSPVPSARAPSRSPPASPDSSSESGSGGSGADTIKRGIPPHRPAPAPLPLPYPRSNQSGHMSFRATKGPTDQRSSPNITNDHFGTIGGSNSASDIVDTLSTKNSGTKSPSPGSELAHLKSTSGTSSYTTSALGSGLYSSKLSAYQHQGYVGTISRIPPSPNGSLYSAVGSAPTTKSSPSSYSIDTFAGSQTCTTYAQSASAQSSSLYVRPDSGVHNGVTSSMEGYRISYSSTNPFLPSYAPPLSTEIPSSLSDHVKPETSE